MDFREPITINKYESSPQNIVREFFPYPHSITYAGKLVVRTESYGRSLSKFDQLFAVMAADALQFEPPLQIDREDVEIVHFAGNRYRGTFGLEVLIPDVVIVSDTYTRISQIEPVL